MKTSFLCGIFFWGLIALLMLGCATTEEQLARENATPTRDLSPLIVMVDNADRICRLYGAQAKLGTTILGCADYAGRIVQEYCVIFITQGSPDWVLEHEKLHCKYGRFH